MLYRAITDLSDDEIKEIVNELYDPIRIVAIRRGERSVSVDIETTWTNKFDEEFEVEDTVQMTDPFAVDGGIIVEDAGVYDPDDEFKQAKFRKFCIAKGVCCLLRNNKYIEEKKETYSIDFDFEDLLYLRNVLNEMADKFPAVKTLWQKFQDGLEYLNKKEKENDSAG